ncbi:MAG: hypothetical protein WCF85_03590 [Rhodospirillaceae bacterium]
MTARHPVAIGDHFIRTGQPLKIYVVTRIDERPHHPPHARLRAVTQSGDDITIAVGTLADRHFFLPVSPP